MTPSEQRALCYRFFSEFFRGTFSDSLVAVWPMVQRSLGLPEHAAVFGLEEKKSWAKLFFGVGEQTVGLSESSWMNAERLHCQQPSLSAQQSYQQAAVSVGSVEGFPADHLAVMLGFMAYGLEQGRDNAAFFETHFGHWLTALSQAVEARTDNAVIVEIWQAFEQFLAQERLFFEMQTGALP